MILIIKIIKVFDYNKSLYSATDHNTYDQFFYFVYIIKVNLLDYHKLALKDVELL